MNNNLNSKSKSALIWSISGSFIQQIAFFFISALIARLLGPAKIGVIAMSTVFISIASMFVDSGFSSALVQKKEVKNITYSSVFYANLLISLLLSLLLIVFAKQISFFLEEPEVEYILYWLSIVPPLSALGLVQAAILRRKIDFKSLTIRDVISNIIGGIFGVIGALNGYGVYSIVIQQIVTTFLGTILLWYATRWRPKWEFSLIEIKKLFNFSGYVFLDTLSQRVFKHIDTLFIAKAFSPTVLGFYSKADSFKAQVVAYATNSLSKVMFPVLSRLQDDDKAFKTTYFKTYNMVTGMLVIIVGILYFLAHFIITTLFGEDWLPSVFLFQILIFSALFNPHVSFMSRAILSKGYSKFMFQIGLMSKSIKLLPIAAGLLFGIKEFTIAIVVCSIIIFIMLCVFVDKKLGIEFKEQIKNFIIPNLIFFALISIHVFLNVDMNAWMYVVIFLVCQFIYIKILRHDSYYFMVNTLKRFVIK